jgi:hypothetical protein
MSFNFTIFELKQAARVISIRFSKRKEVCPKEAFN